MEHLKKTLKEEIVQFRELGHAFTRKEISSGDFKKKSGGMGVYAQKGGEQFMIRLRTPSGIITQEHFKLICGYANTYKLEHIHLTTRQAIQLHNLDIDTVCDIMTDAMDHGLYTRGGGGDFPRNIALSPLSGVEKGEAFDVTPYARQVGSYMMNQITSYHLPRKLKIAFSNSEKDTACATVNDLGFVAVKSEGRSFFTMYLAGGLGNNPKCSLRYKELVSPEDILFHVEAVTRLFQAEGDYQNRGKARLRYVPERMGEAAFFNEYERILGEVKNERKELKYICLEEEKEEQVWRSGIKQKKYLIPQKQRGLYTVILHPQGGQLRREDLFILAQFLEQNKKAEIRLDMKESMYIRNLTKKWALLLQEQLGHLCQEQDLDLGISCIGTPTCQIGIETSQRLLQDIGKAFHSDPELKKWLPSISISGCMNSCARHQVSAIGFAGRKVRVGKEAKDAFELYAGGEISTEKTCFGEKYGGILIEQIPSFLIDLACELKKRELDFDRFFDTQREAFQAFTAKYIVS